MITAIDAHTGGNPERVVTGGIPHIPGKTMVDKMKYVHDNTVLRSPLIHAFQGDVCLL